MLVLQHCLIYEKSIPKIFEEDQIILVESKNTALYYRILYVEEGIRDKILLSFCTWVEGVADYPEVQSTSLSMEGLGEKCEQWPIFLRSHRWRRDNVRSSLHSSGKTLA